MQDKHGTWAIIENVDAGGVIGAAATLGGGFFWSDADTVYDLAVRRVSKSRL